MPVKHISQEFIGYLSCIYRINQIYITLCRSDKKTGCTDLVDARLLSNITIVVSLNTFHSVRSKLSVWRVVAKKSAKQERSCTVQPNQICLLAPSWHDWNNDKYWHQELQTKISQLIFSLFLRLCVVWGYNMFSVLFDVGNQMEIYVLRYWGSFSA